MKQNRPFFNLFGTVPKKDVSIPEGALENLIAEVKDGKLETLVKLANHPLINEEALKQLGGFAKGRASLFVQKVFARTDLRIVGVRMQVNQIRAMVTLEGKTVDACQLIEKFHQALEEKDDEIGILSKQKMNMRRLGLVAGLVDDLINEMDTCSVAGEVPMIQRGDVWELEDSEPMLRLLTGCGSRELEALVQQKFGHLILEQENGV